MITLIIIIDKLPQLHIPLSFFPFYLTLFRSFCLLILFSIDRMQHIQHTIHVENRTLKRKDQVGEDSVSMYANHEMLDSREKSPV